MKKILLVIFIVLCIFQLIVLADSIDIGAPAINRSYTAGPGVTLVNEDNPANGTGKITSIEIWANQSLPSGCKVATFFVVSGNFLSTRDSVILGGVASGNKRTITEDIDGDPISLDVVDGDYLGIYFLTGLIEADINKLGLWYGNEGDEIPCTNVEFTFQSTHAVSLYGTGETEAPPAEVNAIFFGMAF